MTNDELKAIYEYMGWIWSSLEEAQSWIRTNPSWLCVQEMERKGDWEGFLFKLFYNKRDVDILWLYNPTNFFSSFGKWCLERRG